MFVKDVMVQNQVGLHARQATFFIQKANEFKSSIWVEKEERRVNAKSLLGVLSLGIVGGTTIRIIADGTDEETAVESLVGCWYSPASRSNGKRLESTARGRCFFIFRGFPAGSGRQTFEAAVCGGSGTEKLALDF